MNFSLWSFLAGAAFLLALQHVCTIPMMRRHRVVRALLDRAEIYQQRGVALARAGKEEEALKAFRESIELADQAKKLNKV